MIIRMRHSEEKNKTDKSLFAQFPVSLQDEHEKIYFRPDSN